MADEENRAGGVWLTIAIVIVVVGGFLAWQYYSGKGEKPLNTLSYTCDQGKTIQASYYSDHVSVALSDGRSMTLPQTVSGSGIRYANKDESFVLWSKGNTAFVTEGDPNKPTYADCISTNNTGGEEDWNTYASSTLHFSLTYPQVYLVDENYVYDQLGPGKGIKGIKFTVSPDMATGTNLSAFDTGISIEELPNVSGATCSASLFIYGKPKATSLTDNGITYSYATTSGAGAGNFYEEQVYAIPGANPCTAVRYMIHSTNIGNYPPNTVTEFDRQALLLQFDQIRRSLTLGQ